MTERKKVTVYDGFNHPPKVFTSYDPKTKRTKESFKEECDINNIMANYRRTGELSHINPRKPIYGDAPSESFYESLLIIEEARKDFEEIPSEIRKHFDNDPGKFLEFATNSENLGQLKEWGLAYERPADNRSSTQLDETPLGAPATQPSEARAPEGRNPTEGQSAPAD